jgi:hypothetical protein
MIKLGFAIYEMGLSAYGLYQATDRQQKLYNAEALILGALKAALAASVCFSLYTACFVIKNPTLQYALAGVTFCIHPLATLDAIGTTYLINGMFFIITAYIPQRKIAAELCKMQDAALEQVRSEGFKFYGFWQRLLRDGKKVGPPETELRITEVFKAIADKHDFTQIKAWGVPMSRDWGAGLKFMKYAVFSGIGAIFAGPASFWLERRLVDLSKRLAPRLV